MGGRPCGLLACPARTEPCHGVLVSGSCACCYVGAEVSRLFLSFRSNGTGNPAVDQDATSIDGPDEMAIDPGPDGYRARHAQPVEDIVDVPDADTDDTGDTGDAVEPPTGTAVVEGADKWAAEEWDGPEDFRSAVRPYTWTRGRTRPVQNLAVETLVSTSDEGRDVTAICSAEHAAIAELCADIRSVAEVAALLGLPLGVARVLLADMIDTGLVHVYRNPMGLGSVPDIALMERVLDGLYRL
jgi:hypothetical protein